MGNNKNKYSPEEIERGLYALARVNGNTQRASRELKEQGQGIPESTLRLWKAKTHADRYARIREEVIPTIYQRHADKFHELVAIESNIAEQIARELESKIDQLDPRDLATALRNLEVSKSLNFDKASIADGRPTVITEKRDLGDIVRALKAKGIEVEVIEGEAEALPPATEDD